MKHILFLSLILAAFVARSQEFQANVVDVDPNLEIKIQGADVEAQAVEDCVGCKASPSLAPQPVATIQETANHLDKINEQEWANSCGEFINNGQIGKYGEMIRNEISKSNQLSNIKRGDEDLVALCPNYTMMNDSSKANVFLLILTSMAFEESSCDNSKSARGPNGTAKGFFQLHLGKEASYGPECNNYDSRTPAGSIVCALSVINKQMGEGNLFRQDSNYWDVLRPQRWSAKKRKYFANPSYEQIRSAIAEFAPCNEKQSSVLANEMNVNSHLFQVMDKKIFHKNETLEVEM